MSGDLARVCVRVDGPSASLGQPSASPYIRNINLEALSARARGQPGSVSWSLSYQQF